MLLPAAGWGEKDGTVTNSERRISRVRAAVPPPGEARADWRIAVDFARRLGARLGRRQSRRAAVRFDARRAKSIAEHAATTVGRDLDIGGLSHALLSSSARSNGRCRRRRGDRHARGFTPTAVRHAGRQARASSRSSTRHRRRPTPATRCTSTPAGCATSGTA